MSSEWDPIERPHGKWDWLAAACRNVAWIAGMTLLVYRGILDDTGVLIIMFVAAMLYWLWGTPHEDEPDRK